MSGVTDQRQMVRQIRTKGGLYYPQWKHVNGDCQQGDMSPRARCVDDDLRRKRTGSAWWSTLYQHGNRRRVGSLDGGATEPFGRVVVFGLAVLPFPERDHLRHLAAIDLGPLVFCQRRHLSPLNLLTPPLIEHSNSSLPNSMLLQFSCYQSSLRSPSRQDLPHIRRRSTPHGTAHTWISSHSCELGNVLLCR
jgi:hypothetical protein